MISPARSGSPRLAILRHGQHLEMAVMVGIDPQSDGLARA
ncbi:acetaldehyde dehydrogenase (acetylating), partial [Escherichia sp. HC-CC]